MRQTNRTIVVLILVVMTGLPSGALRGQSVSPAEDPAPRDRQFGQSPDHDTVAKMQKEQQKQINKARHEALKKDTNKLLELATELKLYVDKSNENMLSLDVMRKAEQIEKLAHNVREKMKGY